MMQMRAARVGFGVLLAVAVVLAGCGSDDSSDQAADDTSSTVAPPPTGGFGPAPTLADEGDKGPGQFQLPSKNIGCAIDAAGVRCDINVHTWLPPEQPVDCDLDWGNGMVLSDGTPSFTCAGDTVLGGPDTLAYGEAAQRGDYRCESSRDGVTCANLRTKHGFLLSREVYSVF